MHKTKRLELNVLQMFAITVDESRTYDLRIAAEASLLLISGSSSILNTRSTCEILLRLVLSKNLTSRCAADGDTKNGEFLFHLPPW